MVFYNFNMKIRKVSQCDNLNYGGLMDLVFTYCLFLFYYYNNQ